MMGNDPLRTTQMHIHLPSSIIFASAVAVLLCLTVSAVAQSAKQPTLNTDDIADFLKKADESQSTHPWTSAMRQKLAECWWVPPGAREVNLPVKVHFNLARDGSVAGQPEVLNDSAHPLFATIAQSVISAIIECQPFDFLPPEKFEHWKDITITFNAYMFFGN